MGHRRITNTRLINIESVLNKLRPRVFDLQDRVAYLEDAQRDAVREIEDLWEEDEIGDKAVENINAQVNVRLDSLDETVLRLAKLVSRVVDRLVTLEGEHADTDLIARLAASVVATDRKQRGCQDCGSKAPEPEQCESKDWRSNAL